MDIQWYPGHMKKTKDLIKEHIKLVDLIVELVDARAPLSTLNPVFDDILGNKPRLLLMNKYDLAEERISDAWRSYFIKEGREVLFFNAREDSPKKLLNKIHDMTSFVQERQKERGLKDRAARIMVIGIPNVGKSSLINRLVGKASAKVGDRPGVTKGKQWVRLQGNVELFDTPGILLPKFEDEKIALNIAFIGSIKDQILDIETLALRLLEYLVEHYPERLEERYGVEVTEALETMEAIALKRGHIFSKKQIDYTRVSVMILDEFRAGKLGRISLETPER